MAFVFPMAAKSEVCGKIEKFRQKICLQEDLDIRTIRSDNGGEYMSGELKQFCLDHGITHQFTTPYTPESNRVAERLNRTLMEMVRCMLVDSGLNKEFWMEALQTAVYLRNRCPTSALDGQTPYFAWYGRQPSLNRLRVFGSKAFAHVPAEKRKKLDPKAVKCLMLGYDSSRKGWRLWNIEKKELLISRDVVFDESFVQSQVKVDELPPSLIQAEEKAFQNNEPLENHLNTKDEIEDVSVENEKVLEDPEVIVVDEPELLDGEAHSILDDPEVSNDELHPTREAVVLPPEHLRRSGRERSKPNYLRDYVAFAIQEYVNGATEKTLSYEDAMKGPDAELWKKAIDAELESLETNHTWSTVTLPPGRKPLKCKWIFVEKRNENGDTVRYKARLVVKGCGQKEGEDFNAEEIYAPVSRMTSFRLVVAYAAKYKLDIHHVDISTAFLNGKLDEDEEIYMTVPQGVHVKNKDLVCKLHRSLYGLKQAPKKWHDELRTTLLKLGWSQLKTDPCVFKRTSALGQLSIMAVYVDDFCIVARKEEIPRIKEELSRAYKLKDNGQLKFYLGIEVSRKNTGEIELKQTAYIRKLLTKYCLDDAWIKETPIVVGDQFDSSPPITDVPYRSLVGSLLYLAMGTRMDIAYAVGVASRALEKPTQAHWELAKRILRYLKGTIDYGIRFLVDGNLFGYCDSDWAGDKNTRRSTSGYLFFFAGGPVSWRSSLQRTVALSSTEAEFISAALAVQECLWLRSLLTELNIELETTILNEDNQGCILLSLHQNSHQRTKHIDVRYHFIREAVNKKAVTLQYCTTEENLADILTKPLVGLRFADLTQNIEVARKGAC
eukprot:Pompholyxophrys_punicea_v1_NODE_55_length_4195_cov_3.523671.p1 type:complete len:835 gc:universal NODE_55_length_4195_cov_3.523671:1568-4072(+)